MTMRPSWVLATLAAAGALALAGCSKEIDNANAPGRPDPGNSAEIVRPQAPDSPAGGPSGIAGSLPHPGSSGGDAVAGAAGSGNTSQTTAAEMAARPGVGLDGGLGTSAADAGTAGGTAMGAGPVVPDGSPNRTTKSSVGNRD
jgi:hypothetical protein